MSSCFYGLLIMLAGQVPVVEPIPAEKGAAPPAAIAGTWDVEHVLVDLQGQLRWEVRPDDPQLMGRPMVIAPGLVKFESGKELGCQPTVWRHRTTAWSVLIGKGFPRPPVGGRSPTPDLRDFRLKVSKSQKVTAYSLCNGGGDKGMPFPLDQWAAFLSPQSLAVHLDSQVLLLFRRRPKNAKPTPSFACAKATSPTEKAICGNYDLASWDRSVALAFRQALSRNLDDDDRDAKDALKRAQQDWLHERDKCENKITCIDEKQWRRVDELSQQ